ncbi:hypothetical protein [Streptomyces sp. AF1A]|jgi:xanthine dehydrogenase YagT iron-sulfur-binding subunit|uniref:hypothetical protein n=1 Tax=Streptomyces sp. AF1A TaxID=3394350 RepID=UPI0039BD09A3
MTSAHRPARHRTVTLRINGTPHALLAGHRRVPPELLREDLDPAGSTRGRDHGRHGARTVPAAGCRADGCLPPAVTLDGREIAGRRR